ncbi:hypothetical protein BGZ80_001396, partial [Entomortierella chlamydospora]
EHLWQDLKHQRHRADTNVSTAKSDSADRAHSVFTRIHTRESVHSSARKKDADDNSLSKAICDVICEFIVWDG